MESKIRISDLMRRKIITINAEDLVIDAAKIMAKKRFGGMPVVDNGKLIGIVTERDIINKVVAKGKAAGKLKVSDIMTSPPRIVINSDEDISTVAKKMSHFDVSRIPVVDDGKLVGLITNKEVARHAPHLLNYLLEKIRVNDDDFDGPDAFGSCNTCGASGELKFKQGSFVCDMCRRTLK
jgi:CBS domain-containing protein